MKKLLALTLVLVMLVSLAACSSPSTPSTAPSTDPVTESTAAPSDGVGVKFTVTVTDLDGTITTFQYTSEAKTIGEALVAEGLIAGEAGDWGLMVTTVNGITADWATEKAYWAFYIDGEYAETGVDTTELTDGATYSFVKTVSE